MLALLTQKYNDNKLRRQYMADGVINRVPFGVRNGEFEKVGAGSADRYAGDDGLVARVARAAELLLQLMESGSEEQTSRARTLFETRVTKLFEEFGGDATAIEAATAFAVNDRVFSYNSLHVSVPNTGYVPPEATVTNTPNGGQSISYDWSRASHTEPYRDVTAAELLANPQLGTQLVVHNDFHL